MSVAHQTWLEEVQLLLLPEEQQAFLALRRGYQRQAFIDRFWEVRDPFPLTRLNELRSAWERRAAAARERFGGLDSQRARLTLLAGPPSEIYEGLCPGLLRPLELWHYGPGSEVRGDFSVVFSSPGGDRLWTRLEGVRSLLSSSEGALLPDEEALSRISRDCPRGAELAALLDRAVDWSLLAGDPRLLPRPNPEWVAAFLSRSTQIAVGSEALEADLEIAYPGRRQSRTIVQAVVTLPVEAAAAAEGGAGGEYRLLIDGEVLRQGALFESFRYRFNLPSDPRPSGRLPLIFQRHLRPGPYELIVKVEDLVSGRSLRIDRLLEVPSVEPRAAAAPSPPAPVEEGSPDAAVLRQRLEEANASLPMSDQTVKILPPPQGLHTERLRVEALASGDRIAKVRFLLDGRPLLTKVRPPFSVELDLGRSPRLHRLEAVALAEDESELARDRVAINAGPYRFAIRLLEPQAGKRYSDSLQARAEIDLPLNENLERVEFYLNEDLLATLYQPPWAQPILLPEGGSITYVRAVAYLEGGSFTEDLVFINAPEGMDHLKVDLVELYTTVVDRRGRPFTDLAAETITIYEDGEPQKLRRFERVQDLPIHAGLLLDTSVSMAEELEEVEKAALRFFENVIRPKDRAEVIVFSDEPQIKVPFTNNQEVLAGGLVQLEAAGQTALWDSMVFSLYSFSGLTGKRTLVVLTDGVDSRSEYRFEEALDFAKRAGVAIYVIGLDVPPRAFEIRTRLHMLTGATGGDTYYIQRASELDTIYDRIEEEVHSQYLLAYQSTKGGGEQFRTVKVELSQPGLKARTIPGYYP